MVESRFHPSVVLGQLSFSKCSEKFCDQLWLNRSAGYEWFQVNKQKSNYVKVPAQNIKTLSSNVTTIFAVPSSKTSSHAMPLKDLAKQRLKSRYDVSSFSTFYDAMKVRNSCHIIEQSGSEFLCDCHEGKDVYNRKH